MKNIKKIAIAAAIIVVLCIPIIVDIVSNKSLKEIEYKDFNKAVEASEKYSFSLVYVGKEDEDIKQACIGKTVENSGKEGVQTR